MSARTLFTSDLHLGHVNVLEYCGRPFHNVESMNQGLITRWNDQVNDEDTVYVLGDLAMGRTHETIPLARRLAGTKILVRGNHDKATAATYLREGGFSDVVATTSVVLTGSSRTLELCHYPFAGDSRDADRFADRRPRDRGQWLLCGHVHGAWRQRGRAINVGIDAWGGNLVTEADITGVIAQGPGELEALPWS